MPWTSDDADKHKKGLTPKQKEKWAAVANAARERYHDDGRAIRIANGTVGRKKDNG